MEMGEDGVSRVATFGFDQRRPRRTEINDGKREEGTMRGRASRVFLLPRMSDFQGAQQKGSIRRDERDNRLSVPHEEIYFEMENKRLKLMLIHLGWFHQTNP